MNAVYKENFKAIPYGMQTVKANRYLNSKGNQRGLVDELLIKKLLKPEIQGYFNDQEDCFGSTYW